MHTSPYTFALLALTSEIVAAHVSNNTIRTEKITDLIEWVYRTLSNIRSQAGKGDRPLEPAVPIKKSVTPDYIICLEDGKRLKILKRYLKTHYNLTLEAYRERWSLPPNYPMVAPNYSKKRRILAKKIGLGKNNRKNSTKTVP